MATLNEIENAINEVYRKIEALDEEYKRKRNKLENKLDKLTEQLNDAMNSRKL